MIAAPPTEAARIAAEVFADCNPPKYRGLERAARVGRIIAEDVRAGDRELYLTLRDVLEANALTFDPPYGEEKLVAIARARCAAEGIDVE